MGDVSSHLPAYFEAYGRKEAVGPNHIPYSYSIGKPEKAYFELVHEGPQQMKTFMNAMSISQRRVPVVGMYDMTWVAEKAKENPDRLVWVDIGGGKGHTVQLFAKTYPGLPLAQCAVQDLPEVIEEAKAKAEGELEQIQWLPLDFHKEQPVKGKPSSPLPIRRFYADSVINLLLFFYQGLLFITCGTSRGTTVTQSLPTS